MTIEEAIAHYLNARKAQGLRSSSVETIGRTLRGMFESVLAEHIAILTADLVNELRARLGRRDGRRGVPLVGLTRELHWRTSRTVLSWCVLQRLLTTDPLAPRKVQHIGELAAGYEKRRGFPAATWPTKPACPSRRFGASRHPGST